METFSRIKDSMRTVSVNINFTTAVRCNHSGLKKKSMRLDSVCDFLKKKKTHFYTTQQVSYLEISFRSSMNCLHGTQCNPSSQNDGYLGGH